MYWFAILFVKYLFVLCILLNVIFLFILLGKPDYALQSSGGYVVRVRCTQVYSKTTAKFYLFGLPLPWDVFNGPDTIIKV